MRSVFRWLADFANGGQNALLAKPIPGVPPKVSEEEMRWLAKSVRQNIPLQYKFAFGLWTLSTPVRAWEAVIYPAIRAEAKAKGATIYFADQSFYLPPHSPQLQPDEEVRAHVNRQVSRQLVQSKGEMGQLALGGLALGALRRIQKFPELVKSLFRQPECQYAAI